MFKLYEVDPDADTLLIVPASSTPFAEWNHGSSAAANGTIANGHEHHHHRQNGHVNGINGSLNGAAHGPNGVKAVNGINGSINGVVNGLAKVSLNGSTGPVTTTSSPELRIKVSSKHLSLASRHFGNKFKWASADPASVHPDGRVHVTLDGGIDPGAATVVMNIIHGRGHKVPRHVDLEGLAKIGVFVDRYRCYDAVEAYADRWIGQLDHSALEYGRDLVLWIFVAYVFHQADLFRRATAVAISKSTGPIPDLGLPIREKIIRSIDNQRQELVIQAATIVHSALSSTATAATPCTIGTDPFLQSTLVQALSRGGVATNWPHVTKPLHGSGGGVVDFAAVAAAAREVEELHERWHATAGQVVGFTYGSRVRKRKTPNAEPEQTTTEHQHEHQQHHAAAATCVDRLRLTPLLHAIEAEIGGLDLESSLGYYLY